MQDFSEDSRHVFHLEPCLTLSGQRILLDYWNLSGHIFFVACIGPVRKDSMNYKVRYEYVY